MAIVLAIILILALILLFTFASTVSYTLTSFIWPENKSSATVEIDNNDTCDDDTDFNSNQKSSVKYNGVYRPLYDPDTYDGIQDPDVIAVLKDCDEVCSRSPIKKEYLR